MSRELDCGDADAIRKVAAKFIADGDAARLRSRAVRKKKNVSFDHESLQNDEDQPIRKELENSCEGNRW